MENKKNQFFKSLITATLALGIFMSAWPLVYLNRYEVRAEEAETAPKNSILETNDATSTSTTTAPTENSSTSGAEVAPAETDETAETSEIKPVDIKDLKTTKSGEKIIILFRNEKFRIHLKDGDKTFTKLEKANMFSQKKDGTLNWKKPIPLNGKSNENGLFFNIGLEKSKDGKYFTLKSDDVNTNNKNGQKNIGRFSRDLVLIYDNSPKKPQKLRERKGLFVFMPLEVENANTKTLYYIDEKPSKNEILEKIHIKYSELPETQLGELQKKDSEEIKEIFTEKNGENFKYKKISFYKEGNDGKLTPYNDEVQLKAGVKYVLNVEVENPTFALDENNKPQTADINVNIELKDTKTTYKEKLKEKVGEAVNEAANTISKINPEILKKLSLDNPIDDLRNQIEQKEKEIISTIDSDKIKHRDVDTEPIDGDEETKKVAKQNAEAKKTELKNPLVATINIVNAISEDITTASVKVGEIEANNQLSPEQKEELIKKVSEDLKNQIENLKKIPDENKLNEDTIKQNNETFKEKLNNNLESNKDAYIALNESFEKYAGYIYDFKNLTNKENEAYRDELRRIKDFYFNLLKKANNSKKIEEILAKAGKSMFNEYYENFFLNLARADKAKDTSKKNIVTIKKLNDLKNKDKQPNTNANQINFALIIIGLASLAALASKKLKV